MWQLSSGRREKKLKFISLMILICGIGLRFYYQFVEWSFNGDEVDLGLDILKHSYRDIFYPFQSRQSAPPLFLLMQKLFSETGKPYVTFKIISFISSCTSLFLFRRLLKNHFPIYLQVLLLALFCFNPFVLGNSLTLKQYTLDLTLGLIAIKFFIKNRSFYAVLLFFSLFCLLSNAGLFFSASLAIFKGMNLISEGRSFLKWNSIKSMLPFLLAPLPYLAYFFWFMQQPGAEEMKDYMVNYWETAFMPLDLSLARWLGIQVKVLTLFFFSSYWPVGIPVFLLFLVGAFIFIRNRGIIFKNKIYTVVTVYANSAVIHLILSAFKMYPFTDRLFLYLSPAIYLVLGLGLMELRNFFKDHKKVYFSGLFLLFATFGLYFIYLPGKTNDVPAVMRFINSKEQAFVFTPKAKKLSVEWLEFTGYEVMDAARLYTVDLLKNEQKDKADFLIGVQSQKFGHNVKYTTPEPEVELLLAENKIRLYKRVGGYVIYRFN